MFFANLLNAIKDTLTGIAHPQNSLSLARSLFFWMFVCALLTFGTIYFLRTQNQPVPNPTTTSVLNQTDALLAEVGKQKIYKSDVEKLIKKQIKNPQFTESQMTRFLNKAVEQAILDQEIAKNGLFVPKVDENDLENVIKKYDAVKLEITEKNVESRMVSNIGFAIPPTDYPLDESEKEEVEKQHQDAPIALADIEKELKAGLTATDVAEIISQKYPSLAPRVAVNGYIFGKSEDKTIFAEPELFTLGKKTAVQYVMDAVFELKEVGEIKRVDTPNNGGGIVLRLEGVNNSGIKSYEDWLETKKQELVKLYI
jgi:hypothetical protein